MSSVLVVDDEIGMRELLRRWISAHGFLTYEADTAEHALDVLAASPDIHVVVADVQMPGHGGVWLVEQMRERFPSLAVVLATADETVPGTVSLQPSVVEYIVKPIASDRLMASIAHGLAWHHQQSTAARPAETSDPIEAWLDKKLTRGPHVTD